MTQLPDPVCDSEFSSTSVVNINSPITINARLPLLPLRLSLSYRPWALLFSTIITINTHLPYVFGIIDILVIHGYFLQIVDLSCCIQNNLHLSHNLIDYCTVKRLSTKSMYRQTSNISRTLVGNKIVANSDVVGASPIGVAPTTSSCSTWLRWMRQIFKVWDWVLLVLEAWRFTNLLNCHTSAYCRHNK